MSTVWTAKRQKTPHGCAQIAIFHQIFKKLWGFENKIKKKKRKKKTKRERAGRTVYLSPRRTAELRNMNLEAEGGGILLII